MFIRPAKVLFKVISVIMMGVILFSSFSFSAFAETTAKTVNTPIERLNEFGNGLAAFYSGKVTQNFTNDKSKVDINGDLSKYVNEKKMTIKSTTDQLFWDYGNGMLKINTSKSQAVSGFLKSLGSYTLKDVVIDSSNEYATILVTSLDGKPIASSDKLLIQASTEDKLFNFKEKNGTILDLGQPQIMVKNINAKVTLKNRTKMKAISLDENGYYKSNAKVEAKGKDLKVNLPANSMYTIVYKENSIKSQAAPKTTKGKYIIWQGEKPDSTNFPNKTDFSASTFEDKKSLLLGNDWLTAPNDPRAEGEEPLFAKYTVNVDEDGEYSFWTRKFWKHGPFKWRFDDGEWKTCPFEVTLSDNTDIRKFLCANWVYLNNVKLSKGKHTFELEMSAEVGQSKVGAFDAFLLTKDFFVPRGNILPGTKYGKAESGYWAFEPDFDQFKDSLIDLRYLNEKKAGQSGFVKKDNNQILLGNGKPVKFVGVNIGPDVIRSDKKTVQYLARRLAKYGINMVRLHGSVYDKASTDLSKIDTDYLDKLQYFVATLKNEGIYSNISWYFPLWYNLSKDNGFDGYNNTNPFALLEFDSQFQSIYKDTAKNFLTVKNPYTGLSLVQDPAVAMIEIQNEDNYFFWTFGKSNISEAKLKDLETQYAAWLIKKYGSLEKTTKTWGIEAAQDRDSIENKRMTLLDAWFMTLDGAKNPNINKRMQDQLEFLVNSQKSFYEGMVSFLKKDLGAKALISASNWTTADNKSQNALERYTYTPADIIDRHGYFNSDHQGDGSGYSVSVGQTFVDKSVMYSPEAAIMGVVETEGHPQMISETGWTNPNKYKGESIPMWTTYGSLNGTDAIGFFAITGAHWENSMNKFAFMTPTIMGQMAGFSLMFRRQDVVEAKPLVKITHSLKELYQYKGSPLYESSALDQYRDVGPKKTATDASTMNFEYGNTYGFAKSGGSGSVSITSDINRVYMGNGSMNVIYKDVVKGKKDKQASVEVAVKEPNLSLPSKSVLKFRIFVPGSSQIMLQPFVQGKTISKEGALSKVLETGKWVEISLAIDKGIEKVIKLGVRLVLPQGSASKGQIWIDSINYDGYLEKLDFEKALAETEKLANEAVAGDKAGNYPEADIDRLKSDIEYYKEQISNLDLNKEAIVDLQQQLQDTNNIFVRKKISDEDKAYINFEDGLQGFGAAYGDGKATVTLDSTKSYKGKNSCRIDFENGYNIGVQKDTLDIEPGSTIVYRVFVDPNAVVDVQPMVFGKGWKYNGNYIADQYVTKGKWVEYSVQFAEGEKPVIMFGLGLLGAGSKGTVWVDSIEVIPPTK